MNNYTAVCSHSHNTNISYYWPTRLSQLIHVLGLSEDQRRSTLINVLTWGEVNKWSLSTAADNLSNAQVITLCSDSSANSCWCQYWLRSNSTTIFTHTFKYLITRLLKPSSGLCGIQLLFLHSSLLFFFYHLTKAVFGKIWPSSVFVCACVCIRTLPPRSACGRRPVCQQHGQSPHTPPLGREDSPGGTRAPSGSRWDPPLRSEPQQEHPDQYLQEGKHKVGLCVASLPFSERSSW